MADARLDPLIRPPEPRLRIWTEAALLLQAGMESTWIALWYAAMFERQVRVPWWTIWLVQWGIVSFSFGLARFLEAAHMRMRLRRAVFLVWIVLSTLLSLKLIVFLDLRTDLLYLLLAPVRSLTGADASLLPFLHILFIPLLILRGVMLASNLPDTRSALLGFQTGLVALLLHGLLYLPTHPRLSSTGLFLYLFFGLLTMSAVRIAGVTNFRGGKLARLNRTWIAGLLAGALAVVAAGLLLGRISAGTLGELVAVVFLALAGLIGVIVVLLLFPLLTLLIDGIMRALEQLASRFNGDFLDNLQESLAGLQGIAAQFVERILPTLHLMRILIPLAVLAGIVAAVLLWLKLSELYLHAQPEEDASGLPPGSLLGMLRRLARGLRGQGRRPIHPARLIGAARIRRVYAGLMALCARKGTPRKAWLTPLEFLPRAEELFPGRELELEQITRAYIKVRYGELPESREEVEQVLEAWKKLKF